ncbi:Beta-galactoside alpha-2,6-sialyltransferase 2 [Halotydeus destructor]|nr:Beta-galactoside alpha-2,6-sialyltransferase 2 [Halotydeus destructor]
MRFLGASVCFFISLIFMSTLFYTYLIVSHYFRSEAYKGHKQFWSSLIRDHKPPSLSLDSNLDPSSLSFDGQNSNGALSPSSTSSSRSLSTEVLKYKEQLIQKLVRKEKEASNVLFRPDRDKNQYRIPKNRKRGTHYASVSSLCRAGFNTLERSYTGLSDFEVLDYMPIRTLRETLNLRLTGRRATQRTCALVTSAGSLKGAKLGPEIDSHDLIVRFNNAPTEGFEEDVGARTTVRILNSKVLSSKTFNVSLPMYKNSVLVLWDPFVYTADEDLTDPLPVDHDFFENYKMSRAQEPDTPIYILSPAAVWRTWDALQNSTTVPLPKTPPSSGFLGINFLVNFCARLSVYEFVPSIRVTPRCHYYDEEMNAGCTFGDWHPLATEKLFAIKVNYASDYETAISGKVQISGCIQS